MGLAAARLGLYGSDHNQAARLNTLNTTATRTRNGYRANAVNGGLGNGEKGHGYRTGYQASYQQTASGLWCQIIGGADLNDGSVQAYLRWLRHRYNYTSIAGAPNSWRKSYYYYLWGHPLRRTPSRKT